MQHSTGITAKPVLTTTPNPKPHSSMMSWNRHCECKKPSPCIIEFEFPTFISTAPQTPWLRKVTAELVSFTCWACPGKGVCLCHLHPQQIPCPGPSDHWWSWTHLAPLWKVWKRSYTIPSEFSYWGWDADHTYKKKTPQNPRIKPEKRNHSHWFLSCYSYECILG